MTEIEQTQPTRAADPAAPGGPLVDLDDITPDEALLADVRRTRITTPVTRVLLALVVVAGAFLGGALVERWQHKSSSSAASSLISQFRAARRGAGATGTTGAGGVTQSTGGAGTGGFGGGGLGGGATFGTIKLVDGKNVYVQDAQGDVIKVTTNPSTTVSVTKTGKVADLAPGSTVIVQGKQSSDGTTMSATSISQSPLGGGGLFGRG